MTTGDRARLGTTGRTIALLVLAAQILLGALPHTDRAPDGPRLAAQAAAQTIHASACHACALAQLPPAAPAAPGIVAIVPRGERPAPSAAHAIAFPAFGHTTRSRGPPVLPA